MDTRTSSVAEHYNRANLYETIIARLKEHGIGPERITREHIAGVDEFHVRGAQVSVELAREAGLSPGSRVLDAGCGIGGPARMLAAEFGCRVTGIDITEEFIHTARKLSELVGLRDTTEFVCADATNIPYDNETFDFVWTQHAQMNIADKAKFYGEIFRVLKPRGVFIYYDILSGGGRVYYPEPWANDSSISFLLTSDELEDLLSTTGFRKVLSRDHSDEGIRFFQAQFERAQREGPPRVGLQLLMGDSTQIKLANLLKSLRENGIILQSGIYAKSPAEKDS